MAEKERYNDEELAEFKELIDHSYDLVVNGLPKTKRDAIIAANSSDN